MRVVIKNPGEDPEIRNIPNLLASLQYIVGGYIETFPSCYNGVVLIVNDEGKLKGMPTNFYMLG